MHGHSNLLRCDIYNNQGVKMGILHLANSANSFDKLEGGHYWHRLSNGQNGTFSSVVGGTDTFVVGKGRSSNIYSSDTRTCHNLAEMARFLYSSDGKFCKFLTNTNGGATDYVFGNRKTLTYRFTQTFLSDRHCRGGGYKGEELKPAAGPGSGKVTDPFIFEIIWKPLKSDKRHMIAAALFSTVLLAWDLSITYKLKLTSAGPSGYKDDMPGQEASTENYDLKKVSMVLAGMKTFETVSLILLRIMEKVFSATKGLKAELAKLEASLKSAKDEATVASNALTQVLPDVPVALESAQKNVDAAKVKVAELEVQVKNAENNLKSHWGVTNSLSE